MKYKITINTSPILTIGAIIFADINICVGGTEVLSLKIDMNIAEKWVLDHDLNTIIAKDGEGETLTLTPKEWLYSDLFINDTVAQKNLIRSVMGRSINES